MHGPSSPRKQRHLSRVGVAVLVLLLAAGWWVYLRSPVPLSPSAPTPAPSTATPAPSTAAPAPSTAAPAPLPAASTHPAKVRVAVTPEPQIRYEALNQDPALQELMDRRRRQYGLKEGFDLIVGRNESVRIGDKTFSMVEIERLIALREGRIVESVVGDGGAAPSAAASGLYGIHVVRPGENIWNIHFKLLQDYLGQKGLVLSGMADEPRSDGSSSGVGRVLKFSEHMVYIYNLNERRLDQDITLIQPLSKVVIYNMDRVLALLESIDFARIEHVRFDGETLWFPAAR